MGRDRVVNPGLVERHFSGMERSQEQRILYVEKIDPAELARRKKSVDYLNAVEERQRSLAALEELQKNRPLKPPGKR